ncbi:hypothetical protein LCGC14_2612550, partial [marine sediment metagenome]
TYYSSSNQVRVRFVSNSRTSSFNIEIDRLYISYTRLTGAKYDAEATAIWDVNGYSSMDLLRWNHWTNGPSMTFEVWNWDYNGGQGRYDTIFTGTSSASTLSLSGANSKYESGGTVKVHYIATSSSDFILTIDQLRTEYSYLHHNDYWIDATAEWTIPDSYSIDSLDFDHQVTQGSVTFYVYDFDIDDQFEEKTGISLDLSTSPEYIGPSNSIKVRYLSSTEISSATLNIDVLRVNYTTEELIITTPGTLDLTSTFHLDSITSDDTIETLQLTYAFKTDASQLVKLEIWNYNNPGWDLVDGNVYNSFTPVHYYQIGSDYYDSNYDVLFNFSGIGDDSFNFYLDQFMVNYSWTRTNGFVNADIVKTIADSFLNRYDALSNFQKLYNITIEFDYTFTKNNSLYADLAKFDIIYGSSQDSFDLNKDGASHTFSYKFVFDSSSSNSFNVMFNTSNGLLELEGMNYT